MRQSFLTLALAASFVALAAAHARAGGFEYVAAGAEALGRGGAVTARADNPMVLAYNPAGLVELRSSQLLLDLNLPLMHACVDPAGYYGWGAYGGVTRNILRDDRGNSLPLMLGNPQAANTPGSPENIYYSQPYDTVCFKENIVPVPQIAWTMRISEDFGIGFGLIFPAQAPSGSWGGKDGVIHGVDGVLRPAATRYMLLNSSNLGVFPNLGVAYRIFKQLRIGAAFEYGIVAINNLSMAATVGGTAPTGDIIARAKGRDWFVPALTVSAHVVPIDALDVVLAFRFQDDINAKGHINLTTGTFSPGLMPFTNDEKVTSIVQKMPWKLRAGIRYANRFAPRVDGTGRHEGDPSNPEPIHDPLQDERWDLELDVEYQLNGRNDKQVVNFAPNQSVAFVPADPTRPTQRVDFPSAGFPNTTIEKYWQNQISARLGSTITLLPGVAGLNLGAHFENRGINPDYMQIDFFPVQRIGVHGGIILRVHRSIDLVASYAHIFQETIVVAPPTQETAASIGACYSGMRTSGCMAPKGQLASIDKTVGVSTDENGTGTRVLEAKSQGTPDGTARLDQNLQRYTPTTPPYIVNAGRYRSGFDVLAVGVNMHF
jgi:hypothetical protein